MKAIKCIMQAIHASVSMSPVTSQKARGRQQSSVTDLPFPVMVQVLACVPQPHRLSSCALVCTSWAAAAAAATIDPAISQGSFTADAPSSLSALSIWLEQHPSEVVSTRVPKVPFSQGWSVEILHPLTLPCAQLSRLEVLQLQGCKVLLNCSTSNSAVQDATAPLLLPALRELHLSLCEVPVNSLAALAGMQLSNLTALSFGHWPSDCLNPEPAGFTMQACQQRQHIAMLKDLLPCLTQLQSLELTGIWSDRFVSGASLSVSLSHLQHLQSCSLVACCIDRDSLHGLCSKLTSLQLRDCTDTSYEPAVIKLPASGWPLLQQLCITNMPLQAAALAQLTALEVLKLTRCQLHPTRRVTSGPTHNPAKAAEAAGASELLSAVAQLTQLRELSLEQINLHAIDSWHTYQPRTVSDLISSSGPCNTHLKPFEALTASNKLERLELVFSDSLKPPVCKRQPVPPGSLQYMFPPGRKLQGLTELVLEAFGPDCDAWEGVGDFGDLDGEETLEEMLSERWDFDDEDIDTTESSACVQDDDVQAIAACCPNLKRLTLNGVVESDPCSDAVAKSFRAVQHQLQLTHLCLGGPWVVNNTAAVVAGMTTLRSLQLHNAPQLAANGLRELTALRQLQELRLDYVGCNRQCYCFESNTPARETDVWRQLAGDLDNIRRSQQQYMFGSEDYDYDRYPEVDMYDWSDWSDYFEGSDAGSDS